jgi:hypothetical protein
MPMRLTVGTHYAGQTSWWLNGQNHSVVAWAGRTFDSVTDATTGRQRLQNMVRHRRIRSLRGGAWQLALACLARPAAGGSVGQRLHY